MNMHMVKFTPDGEVFVEVIEGKQIVHELRTVDLVEPLGVPMTIGMATFMNDLFEAIKELRRLMPERGVPVTRLEAPEFFEETDVFKGLINNQLIKVAIVSIPLEGRPECVTEAIYFTPQGRAYIRKYIDHLYAVTSET